MMRVLACLSIVLMGATIRGAQPAPPRLSSLLHKAKIVQNAVAWCPGEFRPGRTGAYAVAVRSSAGGGRYLVVEPDATLFELGAYTDGADLSCYTPAEARALSDNIRRSDTIEGAITPQHSTTVVCAFVENTRAVCWQHSPSKRGFVKVGEWVT